jgi:hypothetical protein
LYVNGITSNSFILEERVSKSLHMGAFLSRRNFHSIERKIGEAGLTVTMNLKGIAESAEREVYVVARIIDEFAVSVAPDQTPFRSPEIRWFGVCFSAEEERLKKVLDWLAKGVGAIRAIAKCFKIFRCYSFPFTASSSS